MQKLSLFFLLLFSASCGINAQKTPPPAVSSSFASQFKNVTDVDWEKEKNGDWEAEFEQNGSEMSANFNAAGALLETETEIQFDALPAPVQAALKGKKVKETAKIVRADGTVVYEAEVKKKDLLFDAGGKLLETKKD